MIWGLQKSNKSEKNVIDLNEIAKQYKRWMSSPPFDIGTTTANAFADLDSIDSDFAKSVKSSSIESNADSQSNGSLMRITPMIVWASALDSADFLKAIIADVELTHPN